MENDNDVELPLQKDLTSAAILEVGDADGDDKISHKHNEDDGQHSRQQQQPSANITRIKQLKLQQLEESLQIRESYLREKFKILTADSDDEGIVESHLPEVGPQLNAHQAVADEHFSPHGQPHLQSTPRLVNNPSLYTLQIAPTLTSSQLAARQCIPRDLPTFRGDPEEWHIFISAYEQTKQIAGFSDYECLMRLQRCLIGKARDVVRNMLVLPNMVGEIINTLRMYFGRPEIILNKLIEKMRQLPPPRGRLGDLIDFAVNINNVVATIEACKLNSYFNNPLLLHELISKLTEDMKLKWALHSASIAEPTLRDFSAWLSSLANAASRVATPSFLDKPLKKEGRVHVHQTAEMTTTAVRCYICGGGHKIMECEIFKNEPTNQRWRIVKEKKLCRQCLGEHRRRCFNNKVCGIDGCNARHHPMLHSRIDQSTPAISFTANNVSSDVVEQISLSPYSNKALLNNHNSSVNKNWSYCRILPVTLYGTKRTINTYALMDDGSTLTLIEASLADELGNDGIQDALCINWTGNISRQENNSKRLNLQISANAPQAKKFPLKNVRTISNLRMSAESFAADKIKQWYPHLDGLPLASYTNAVPMLIIGVNNPNLISALKVREGGWQEPVAVKTRLGWTVFGSGELNHRNNLNLHKCSCGQEADRELHELVKTFIVNENVAVATPKAELLSVEDQRAEEIMRKCQLRGNRYVVNLPWNTDTVELPNSLPMALRRAECLRRKMHGDPELCQNLKEQITTLVSKGYATELPPEAINERGGKIWYLPIFIVRNLLKPKKHRLVWDAAAKAEGVSLNDFLLKGPDMLRPLINILLNFRIGRIAVCGDIAEMFHRILVQEADTDAQRFLWFSETFKNICVYKLNVVSFGARCSPYIAHFIRNLNAERFIAENPRAVYAIKNNHYVDDFIDSTNSIEQAIALAEAVRNIHEQGGFHMRSWTSNAPEVLAALNENGEQTGKSFDNNIDTLPIEKILGMYWDPKSDCFKYVLKFVRLRRNVFADEIVPTKREVLQILMSIFDPLGLAACLTSYLKILIQDIWRSGIDWDQPLVPDLMGKWLAWVACMPIFANISVPRCYSPYITESSCDVQIHTFVDASEFAYAAVSYFRIKDKYGVSTRIVAAKTKVAPMRPMSIPRMELQAAVIGTRLMNTICKVHTFDIKKRFIWSDSKTVLKWLRGDPRQFQQFVMFRIAEIQEASTVEEWRWVPTKLNTADSATKTKQSPEYVQRWVEGPEFLLQDEDKWPTEVDLGPMETSETRAKFLYHRETQPCFNYEYFSSWIKLYRAVANWLLYIGKLKARCGGFNATNVILTVQHIERAKLLIYKSVQQELLEDWSTLKMGRIIERNSPLYRLQVYMDNNELIRVKNRASNFTNECKPQTDFIFLPPKHRVSYLICAHYHERFYHIQHETALNEVRQLYFIPKLRPLFKSMRRNCNICKISSAIPQAPQMALLPPARLAAFQRPFTHVGIDYFGPMVVIENRKALKRWGVIITCLTIRAVHIEIAHSLSTDSCLMCLRNFIARRGEPITIYSDNATNFHGVENVLRKELKNIDSSVMQHKLAHQGIDWKFNPPAAPHMGGAWERLIRTIKTVLYQISPSQRFTDESLRTALLEVEMIINSRPLTYVSLDSEDEDPITPNHFLLGSANGLKPFCDAKRIDPKMCLLQSEMFANQFWRRWVREILPTLTRRGKWFNKVKPITVGDVVLIVDETAKRNTWVKGIVIETTVAKDGQVRRAKVKTTKGFLERPAVKLAILDIGKVDANDIGVACGEENVAENCE
ncbi:uncharacterized protein LOC119666163 [Teleopsis dalmanni]|uniref:uncharacterized protein LOC119666163 n=1 Tax=Teleopsis dalmanni TaxID=139649 RepID=UPI0018CE95CB|nr:uncharacterized protein LOC119666163 [Teleopsis dalmanni]